MTSAASRRRVLVADDDPHMRAFFQRLIGMSGQDVATAASGRQALELLRAGKFDAIVSDISMPDLGGIELLRQVREHDLDVPVILVTGDPNIESAVRAVQYGALRYLEKPVNGRELLDALTYAMKVHDVAKAKRAALDALGKQEALASDRAGLEASFDRALDAVTLAFQPIVQLSARKIYAYEALLRSKEPTFPSPPALLEAAERLDRVAAVGRVVRRRASEAFARLPASSLVFVNVHPLELYDEDLYDPSAPLSRRAERVVLELTERARLEDIAELRPSLKRLRSLGYRFAVDDLGGGYAGLTSFVQVEPEVVKIDMSLVRDVDRDERKRRLVLSVRELCHDLRTLVVGEGVETRAEHHALRELGLDFLQGYVFARPSHDFVALPDRVFA